MPEADLINKDIQDLKIDMAVIKNDVASMKETLEELKEDMPKWTKILYTIYGADGNGGIVKDVETLKTTLEEIKAWKTAIVAKIAVITTVFGAGLLLLKDFILTTVGK